LHRGYAIESTGAPVIYPEKEAVREMVVAAGEYAHDLQPLTKVLPVTRLVRNTVDAVYQRVNDSGCSSNRGKQVDYQHKPPVEDAGSYPSSLLGGVYRRQTPGILWSLGKIL
jgi:hypothetical protein